MLKFSSQDIASPVVKKWHSTIELQAMACKKLYKRVTKLFLLY